MSNKEIDLESLEKELIEIYNSTKRPNKLIEKKLKEVLESDES
ncbi:MAG: hypothetical protein ACTSPQ_09950 [Candidatus Helarchaeota archaeon]